MKQKKKGFTLVELLVVIAILAVLATVSIIGYTSFIKKANISNDNTVVGELNHFIKAADVVEDINTTSDAAELLKKDGFDLASITNSTKDYHYAYDVVAKKFCLVDEDYKLVDYSGSNINIFVFVKNEDEREDAEKEGFSTYLQAGYVDENDAPVTSITTSKGIDTGENVIASILYQNNSAQNVVIRTNDRDTVLTINAPEDEVTHYGVASEVNIIRVKMGTYTETGTVIGNINVANGKVELSGDAQVSNIVVKTLTYTDESGQTQTVEPAADKIALVVNEAAEVSTVISNVAGLNVTGTVKSINPAEHADAIAYNTNTGYITAWDNTLVNGTTILLKDLEDQVYHLRVAEDVDATFDLNGHQFKTDENEKTTLCGCLTIKDSVGTGRLYCKVNYADDKATTPQNKGILSAYGQKCTLTIESGLIEAMDGEGNFDNDKGQFGITARAGANVIINGGTIKSAWGALLGNGSDTEIQSNIVINGGNIISVYDYALTLPHNCVTNIYGGLIDGAAGAIFINRGIVNIYGGKFASNGSGNTGTWSDGTGGSANAIININAKYGDSSLIINGGEFDLSGTADTFKINNSTFKATLTVTAGTYNFDVSEYVGQGFKCVNNGNGTWTVVKK